METKKNSKSVNGVNSVTPGEITLIASGPAPEVGGVHVDDYKFNEIVDCGFNAIMSAAEFDIALEICNKIDNQNINLKYISSSFQLVGGVTVIHEDGKDKLVYFSYDYNGPGKLGGIKACQTIVDTLKGSKCMGAWRCMDEPGYSNFTIQKPMFSPIYIYIRAISAYLFIMI